MIQLGVSLYPEQETLQQIEDYLKLANSYGFSKVFTSLFSVEGTKEEIIGYFRNLSDIAHKYGMQVYGDCNARFFMQMNASPEQIMIPCIKVLFLYQEEGHPKRVALFLVPVVPSAKRPRPRRRTESGALSPREGNGRGAADTGTN